MRVILTAFAALMLLSACAPLNIHYKEGQTVSRMSTDLASCDASALKQVPKDIRTRYVPATYSPYGFCKPFGPCFSHYHLGGYGYGKTERYDANEGKRKTASTQCMSALGYSQVEIPPCSAEVTRGTTIRSTQKLPPLTKNSCSIRLKSGGWQIVTPG